MNAFLKKLQEVFTLKATDKLRTEEVVDHLTLQLSTLKARHDLLIYKYDSERKEKDKGLRRQAAKLKSLKIKVAEATKLLRNLEIHIISHRNLYISETKIAPKLLAEYTLCTQHLRQIICKLSSH